MSKSKRVLFLANYDWSNVGYEFAQSLKAVGVDADMYIGSRHPFKYYKEGLLLIDRYQLNQLIIKADIVQFMHSQLVSSNIDLAIKKCYVFHGGSRYRENSEIVNMIFNPYVRKSLIQTTNLMGLGAKDEVWMLPAINTEMVARRRARKNDKLVIGHYPGQSIHKGSDKINNVMKRIMDVPNMARWLEYRHSTECVSWIESINRMSECDIYIENLNIGSWGVTALEAAALGCVVITNFYERLRYLREYGQCEMLIANDEQDLERVLTWLINTRSREAIRAVGQECRKWAEKNHGYRATGERLKEIYEL